jgi:uncharacterized protein (DUF983 family)
MEEVQNSVTASVLKMKCPKCHQGNLFITTNPYKLSRVHEMPEYCLDCGQSFEPEPGFYTGGMYVNYAFTIVLTALAFLVLEVLLSVPAYVFFSIYVAVLLLIGPFMFRYSRVVYLYMFVRYDKEAARKHKLPDSRM